MYIICSKLLDIVIYWQLIKMLKKVGIVAM